jgi:catechol 2,3-dioxygenase-like lactoylglutathione lyase family enzyme
MPGPFLSYVGIRVTNLERSLRFYTEIFGLKEVARGDNTTSGKGPYILLRDDFSGQKLELNFYLPGTRFATPFEPGEGLDHISFRVEDVGGFVAALHRLGIEDAPGSPNHVTSNGNKIVYVKDPDGNWIEIYEHREEKLEGPPKGY